MSIGRVWMTLAFAAATLAISPITNATTPDDLFDEASSLPPHFQSSPSASPLAGTPASGSPAVARINIGSYDYHPSGLQVPVGTRVRWVNRDGVTHTVTASDESFVSGPMHRGGVFAHTFAEPGIYRYGCDLHLEMSGAVTVVEE